MPQVPGFLLRALDANADPVSGATLLAFTAGTTTAQTLYLTDALTTPTTPTSDAAGAIPAAYIATGVYKFDVQDSGGASLPGYPIDNVAVFGTLSRLVGDDRQGNTFNILDYVSDETGGGAQVDLILAGDYASQDADIVTAGVQKAAVAFYEAGAIGTFRGGGGVFRMNLPIFGGTTTGGKSVQRHIHDDDLDVMASGVQPTMQLDFDASCCFAFDATFSDPDHTAGHFPDKVAFRWQHGEKRVRRIVGRLPYLFWAGTYAQRYMCPTGFKFRRTNLCNLDFQAAGPRGIDGPWPGLPIHMDDHNNLRMHNVQTRGGSTFVSHEVRTDDAADTFEWGNTSKQLDDSADLGRFATPAAWTGTDAEYWAGLKVSIGGYDTAPTSLYVGEVSAYVDDNSLNLVGTGNTVETGLFIGFAPATCSVTDNQASVIMREPVLTTDMVGKLMAVEALRDNQTESRLMTAYISSVSDAYNCTLVGEDGDPARFGETITATTAGTGAVAYLMGGAAITQCYDSDYRGSQNNDIGIFAIASEAGEGGAITLQSCTRTFVYGLKGHGVNGDGGSLNDFDFTKGMTCLWVDNSEHVTVSGAILSWANYIDPDTGRASLMKLTGTDTHVILRDVCPNGSADVMDVIDATNCGATWRLTVDGGESRMEGWKEAGTDHNFIAGPSGDNLADHVFAGAPVSSRVTFKDMIASYRGGETAVTETIASGVVSNDFGATTILLAGEGDAADTLDYLRGYQDGQTVYLQPATSNDITITHNVGSLNADDSFLLPDGSDEVLTLARQGREFKRVNGVWQLSGGT